MKKSQSTHDNNVDESDCESSTVDRDERALRVRVYSQQLKEEGVIKYFQRRDQRR